MSITPEHTSATEMGCSRPTNHSARQCTLLVVDHEKLVRLMARRYLKGMGHRILEAADGLEALGILHSEPVDLVLCDWVMPRLDGPGLCEAIKHDPCLNKVTFIFMTALDDPHRIAEGLRIGADDFLAKTASDQEISARVAAGLRSRQLLLDLEESHSLLSKKQAELEAELQAGSEFILSLLPAVGEVVPGIMLDWRFVPSLKLGGDLFQVNTWGDDYIGLMILDMSGHGVGAALRAVSVADAFREDSIRFRYRSVDPGRIVTKLNQGYPMTGQGEYFTIWLGTYQRSTKILRYVTAGHPGAVVITQEGPATVLGGKSWPVGFCPEGIFTAQEIQLRRGDRLYLFSDGIYEVCNGRQEILGRNRLRATLERSAEGSMSYGLDMVMKESQLWQGTRVFNDDVALVGLELSHD